MVGVFVGVGENHVPVGVGVSVGVSVGVFVGVFVGVGVGVTGVLVGIGSGVLVTGRLLSRPDWALWLWATAVSGKSSMSKLRLFGY